MNETVTRQKLAEDLKVVVKDAEILLRETAGQLNSQINEKAQAARSRLEKGLDSARQRLAELESDVRDQANAAVRATDDYVKDNPWQSAGIAVGVGFILGVLIGRGSR